MATCPACGSSDEDGGRFCGACGAQLTGAPAPAAREPAVPAPRDPRDYTPKHLADKILLSKAAIEGERKRVTVLFADIKSSLELSEQVDPEQWHGVLNRLFEILSEGVHRFEGTVNQYTGDGIMALFGAPIAHEDHAQRACFAALHLREQLQDYRREVKREHGLGLSVRMGLHSGDVVVGKIGDDLRMDYTAQGHTVGIAQRMEELAEPNTCYLSNATAALAAGYFDLEDLGEFTLKGVAQPISVFELRGIGELRTRFDVSRARGLTRFVGRDRDMGTLEQALEQAQAGHGQVVGVVAEAGTGKSRLCFEFVERCRSRGLEVLEGQAVAHGKAIPYLPMLQVFRSFYGVDARDDDRTVREKIAGRLLLLDEGFREVLPVMFEFFGVPDPDRPSPPMDPDAKKRQLFAVLRTLVQRQDPSVRTFVTLIEDLHWMDPGSEEFLAEWVGAIASASRLLVVNFRPEYHAEWMQKSWYRQLPLAPLGPDAIRELLDDLIGADPSTAGLAEAIHARTGGNPFFTEEVAQSLIESGHLEGTRGAYRLVTPVEELEVPGTVQPLLASRIDRLPEREKRVLQIASVIGKEFSEPVLARVANLPGGELGTALDALKQGEFVYEQAIYPIAEYAFKHPLTQEVALTTQLRDRRASLHAEVAGAIEALDAAKLDERAALLAHHWEEANEPIIASRWHRRAAERIGQSDITAANRHWQRVRELTAHAGAEDAEAAELAIEACLGLLSQGFRLGLAESEQEDLYASGRHWAERSGNHLASARLEATASALHITAGRCEPALEHALACERAAEDIDDPATRANLRYPVAYVWYNTGPLDRATQRLDETIEVAREHGMPAIFGGEDMLPLCLQLRSQLEADCGDVGRAYQLADEALRIARERGLVESEGWASGVLATLQWIDGDLERALPRCRRSLEIAEQIGSPFSIAHALDGLATVMAHAGDPAALELAERSVALSRQSNTSLECESTHLTSVAEACRAAGDPARAVSVALEAYEVARRRGTWHWAPRAAVALARALRKRSGAAAADEIREALARAEESARRVGAPNQLALIDLERAALAELEGDPASREILLRQALGDLQRMGASFRAAQVERLLAGD
jgi:class 3 adenylate cyclase/tetratricopeptide (TPR) repeat protein